MKNILIAIIVIIVIFAILELVTRLFFPQNLNYTMFDENLMFRHVPNLEFRYFWTEFDNKVRFNSKGLRDYEYPYEKANGTYRIMILGDSLPAALQVRLNETFPKVLEQKLRINSKIKRYEVINAAVGGYGTENELLFLELEGVKYKPDMVMLAFAMSDIDENALSPLISMEGSKLVKNVPVKESLAKRFLLYCSRYSHLCAWTHNVILENLKQSGILRNFLGKLKVSSSGNVRNVARSGLAVYSNDNPEIFRKALNETFLEISELNAFAKKNNIRLLILAMPQQEQVDNKTYREFLKSHGLNEKNVDIAKFQKLSRSFSESQNITIIDPLNYFRQRNANTPLYFNFGGHFSVNGHNAIAEYIYDEMERLKLIN